VTLALYRKIPQGGLITPGISDRSRVLEFAVVFNAGSLTRSKPT